MKERQLITTSKPSGSTVRSSAKDSLSNLDSAVSLGTTPLQSDTQERKVALGESEDAESRLKNLKLRFRMKDIGTAPNEEPIITEEDALDRKETIAMFFHPPKPSTPSLETLSRHRSLGSTPKSLPSQAFTPTASQFRRTNNSFSSAHTPKSTKEKKGTMYVTELWSEKHSKNVRVKSGIMLQAKEIEEKLDMNSTKHNIGSRRFSSHIKSRFGESASAMLPSKLKERRNFSVDRLHTEGSMPSSGGKRLPGKGQQPLSSSFVHRARHYRDLSHDSSSFEARKNIETEESVLTLDKTDSNDSMKVEKQLRNIIRPNEHVMLPPLQLTKTGPTWKSNFAKDETVPRSNHDVSGCANTKEIYGAFNKLIDECNNLVTPESDMVSSYIHFDIRKMNLDLNNLPGTRQPKYKKPVPRKPMIELDEDAEDEDLDRALEFESLALALATRKKYRS